MYLLISMFVQLFNRKPTIELKVINNNDSVIALEITVINNSDKTIEITLPKKLIKSGILDIAGAMTARVFWNPSSGLHG